MSSYDGDDLFGSGPHRFAQRSAGVRVQQTTAPGVDGARLTMLGRSATRITQTGRLVAAEVPALLALRDAILDKCDGRAADLVDGQGATSPNMVIVRFEMAGEIDIGRVCSLRYEIDYVEAG
jgi:hypothetical protein